MFGLRNFQLALVQRRSLKMMTWFPNPKRPVIHDDLHVVEPSIKRLRIAAVFMVGLCIYGYKYCMDYEKWFIKEVHGGRHRPPFKNYAHLRKNETPMPWGDGKHSLFFNPKYNATKDGYEADEHGKWYEDMTEEEREAARIYDEDPIKPLILHGTFEWGEDEEE